MISKKTVSRFVGLPVVFGLVTTPVLATTPDPAAGIAPASSSAQIEIIYPRYAQVGGEEIGGSDSGSGGNDNPRRVVRPGPPVEVSEAQTTQIVTRLNQIQRICEFMGDEYRIACFATTYRQLADDIPANGDYADSREVLLDTARKLDNLVRSNLDRSKPALRARTDTPSGQVQTPPMRAIEAPSAPQLNRQASAIVEEAETVLLRSASSDAARSIHYQRIAAAVGSNKVLLRSG